MPAPIEVITTLEFLGTDAANVSTFGLLVQVGVPHAAKTPTPNVGQNDSALLQPWMWSNPMIEVRPWDGAKAGAALTPLPAIIPPPSYATAGKPAPAAIITALQTQFDDLLKTQPSEDFSWIDGESSVRKPGAAQYSWPSRLAQLGRYPYPIPHRLQLAYLLTTAAVPNGKYVGAVNFTVTIGGVATTYGTTSFVPGADATRVSIVYSGSVSGITQPIEVKPLGFPLPMPVVTGELTDWQTQLVSRAADMFDLSNRVVRSARLAATPPDNGAPQAGDTNLVAAVASGFTGFVTAVVAAQRDIVAYGCRVGPDGSSLLSRTLARWIVEKASPGEAVALDAFSTQMQTCVIAARAHDASDSGRFLQKWLTTLATGPDFQGSSIVPPLPAPMSQISMFKPGPAKAGDLVTFDGQVFRCKQDRAVPTIPDGTGDATWQTDWDRVLTLTLPATIQQNQVSDRVLAVEHFQLQFTQKDVLTRLLLAQWQAAAVSPYAKFDSPGYLQQFLGRANALLAELDIRGLLLRGNLDDVWSNVISPVVPPAGGSASVTRDSLKANLSKQFGNRLTQLFAELPGTLACLPANACDLRDACLAKLAVWRDAAIADALPDSVQAPTVDAHQTEGLSIAIDAHVLDDVDSLEQGAGLLVLMRKQGTPQWRCLNLTYVQDKAGQSVLADLAAVPLVAPVPEHLQEGLRRAILTYNNQPLMSKGPAHCFSDNLVPSPDTHVSRIVHYLHPSFSEELDGSDAKKIPGLAFGQSYEFYICRISNTGILPPELAVPGDPGLLKDLTALNVAPQGAVVSYTRRAKVNTLRFGPNGGSFDKLQWPAIPDDATPYAREIGLAKASSDPGDPRPLLLLSSYATPASTGDFVLPISKPTTDLLTWDRWMAGTDAGSGNTAIRQQRENVWKAFHYQARRESTKAKLSIDDPAVTGLVLTVTRVSSGASPVGQKQDGTPGNAPWNPKPWPAPGADIPGTADNLFPMPNAAPPLNVEFKAATTGSDVIVQDGVSGWIISLPLGAVVSVTVTPVIDPAVKSFFAGNALPTLTSYTLVAEAADSRMPPRLSLRQALTINPLGSPPGSVTFELPLSTMQASDHWMNVAAADLRTQEWRWDGRPVPPFPVTAMNGCISASSNVSLDLVHWELAVFLNRTLADATVRPMTRKQTTGAHATDYTFTSLDDRSTEMGATYYRAAVQVKNRYGALVPEGQRMVETLDLPTASVPGNHGGWARCYVPASIPAGYKVPKPAVKFIVPLTGSEDPVTSQGASSVLVVMQGPWFAIGGLAEQFLVELTKHGEPPNPNWQETGPDPITYQGPQPDLTQTYTFGDSKGPNHFKPTANATVDGYFLRDAVGHTFDSSDANPLWVNSSFVLDPPTCNGSPAPGGSFARVQFRRVILNPKPELTLCSDATDPVWVQFLPGLFSPFAKMAPVAPTMDNVSLDVGADFVQLWVNQKLVTLTADPNEDGTHTVFALLLTEQVSDLVGRSGQERYKRILFQQSAPNAAKWSNPGGVPTGNYIARILMIQRQTGTTAHTNPPLGSLISEKQLWDELFPPSTNDRQQGEDAISRIVSVSRPISSQPANCATTQTMRN